jgi:hypothetical protein
MLSPCGEGEVFPGNESGRPALIELMRGGSLRQEKGGSFAPPPAALTASLNGFYNMSFRLLDSFLDGGELPTSGISTNFDSFFHSLYLLPGGRIFIEKRGIL